MVDKKGKYSKKGNHHEKDEKNISEIGSKKDSLSGIFLDELKGAFSNFNKIPESHRLKLYGDKAYLDQFWEHFKKEHPNLLDKIDKKDLPIYIQALEDK
jgi:hypothetical protein